MSTKFKVGHYAHEAEEQAVLETEEENKTADSANEPTLDPVDPESSETIAAGEEATTLDQTDADEIVIPDVGNQEVDRISEEVEAKQKDISDNVDGALSEADRLLTAMEHLTLLQKSGGYNEQYALQLQQGLVGVKTRLGFNNPQHGLAIESFQSTEGYTYSQESMAQMLRTIWTAFLNAMKRFIELAKKAIKEYLSLNRRELARTRSLAKLVLDQREAQRRSDKSGGSQDRLQKALAFADLNNFVSLPVAKRLLTYMGKQPGDYEVPEVKSRQLTNDGAPSTYTQEFERLLRLAKTHELILEKFGHDFVIETLKAAESIMEGKPITATSGDALAQMKIFPADAFISTQDIDGLPRKNPTDVYLVQDFLLGSFRVVHCFPAHIPVGPIDSLTTVANWRAVLQANNEGANDSSLRRLTDTEVKEGSLAAIKMAEELFKYEGTLKTLEQLQKQTEKTTQVMSQIAEKRAQEEPEIYNEINLCIKAINAVVTNVNATLVQYPQRMFGILYAWNQYLQATYVTEKKLIASMT